MLVRVEFEGERKFVLEVFPDFVIFTVGRLRSKAHFVLKPLVELLSILPILAEHIHLHVTFPFEVRICTDFEKVLLLRIEDSIVISELEKEVGADSSSHVQVMNAGLWHSEQTLIEW